MTNTPVQSCAIALPSYRPNVAIRPSTMDDLPFIDSLQKAHTKQVGWMPMAQLEQKITRGHVLVAEEDRGSELGVRSSGSGGPSAECRNPNAGPVGYCIGQDQYFKRDDCGIIYQMNVVPDRRRGLIGASLLKAMFERSAYGCRLICCWCAQDIEANYFWESLGFVPLAFRAGSRGRQRVHIFWQRRIRAGDTTTPYWFPSQTTSGSIREDRLVFPIPPGTHWSDAKPIILPGEGSGVRGEGSGGGELPGPKVKKRRVAVVMKPANAPRGGLWFAAANTELSVPKPKRDPKPRRAGIKNDPRLVAAARELRDRWLEQVNSGQGLPELAGKYEVGRLAA